MNRSRWLIVQAAVLLLGASVVPSVRAQPRCPFMARFQMQTQTRFAPPPMMMPQIPIQQQHFLPPHMMTPPRMPIAARPMQPLGPRMNFGAPHLPRLTTPAFELRVPTMTAHLNMHTQTTWQTHLHTENHLLHFPTLRWHHTTWYTHLHTGYHGHNGFTHWTQHLTMGIKRIPTLGFGTLRWTTHHTTRTPLHETRWTGQLTMGTGRVRIPSLNFGMRPTPFTPNRPLLGGPNPVLAKRSPVVGPNPVVAHAPKPAIPPSIPKAGRPNTTVQVTGRLNLTCGSCHNCKQAPPTGLVVASPPRRQPILPVLSAPPVTARPGLTLVGQLPIPRQPLVSLFGPPLTFNPTSLTALTAPPMLVSAPGKNLFTSSAPPTTSKLTDLFSTTPTATPLTTAVPLVVADLYPPSLAPLPQTTATKLQLPSLVELMVPAEPEKAAAVPVAKPQGPALVLALLQPPLLPSGATVTPVEVALPALDEPPVLPALVDTLIQPPPLPPLPGA